MRRVAALFSGLLVAVLCLIAFAAHAGEEDVVKAIVAAKITPKQFALPSAQLPDLTLEKGYAIQRKVTEALAKQGVPISGFKAGLTAKPIQKKFGVDTALLGPLFKPGELAPGAEIAMKDFVKPFIEVEIGYFLAKKVDKPVKDAEELKKLVKEVCPAIELPDLRYADLKNLKGPDLACDAVASAKYIAGKRVPLSQADVSQVKVTLSMDGKTVFEGKSSDAMGNQWDALLWLVNSVVKQGHAIEPGQILITGALGKMVPAKPGVYEADLGDLGSIGFSVK